MHPDGALVTEIRGLANMVTKTAAEMKVVHTGDHDHIFFEIRQVKTAYADVTAVGSTTYHCIDMITSLIHHGSNEEMQNHDAELNISSFQSIIGKMQRSSRYAENCLHSLKAGCALAISSCTTAEVTCREVIKQRQKKKPLPTHLKVAKIAVAAVGVTVTGAAALLGAVVTGGMGLLAVGPITAGVAALVGGTVAAAGTGLVTAYTVLAIVPDDVLTAAADALSSVRKTCTSICDAAARLGYAVLDIVKILSRAAKALLTAVKSTIDRFRRDILPLLANSSSSYQVTKECCENIKTAQQGVSIYLLSS